MNTPTKEQKEAFAKLCHQDWIAACASMSDDDLKGRIENLKISPSRILEAQQTLMALGLLAFSANDEPSSTKLRECGMVLSAFAVRCRLEREANGK